MIKEPDDKEEHLPFLEILSMGRKGLSTYAHWVYIKLAMLLDFDKEHNEPLDALAQKVGIQHKKLRAVLDELEQVGLISVSYPNQGRLSRVRAIKLVHGEIINNNFPLISLISFLMKKAQGIRVSSKNDDGLDAQNMDFREFLLLLTLLRYSDKFGIVMGCGTKKIYQHTGLKKLSVHAYLKRLCEKGFILSRAEGSIRNAFITCEDPIYSLNLAHPYWEEAAIYGRYYIIKYPECHQFEVDTIGKLKDLWGSIKKIKDQPDNDLYRESLFQNIIRMKSYFYLRNSIHSWKKDYKNKVLDEQSSSVLFWFVECLDALRNADPDFLKCIRYEKIGTRVGDSGEKKSSQSDANKNDRTKQELLPSNSLLQCYIEQHTSKIYSNTGLLPQLHLCCGVNLPLFGPQAFFSYAKEYQFYSRAPLVMNQNIFHDLILGLIELIATNQIYFYLIIASRHQHQPFSENKAQTVKPFRIIPRSKHQNRYSCVFVLEPSLKRNEYFLGELALMESNSSNEYVYGNLSFDDEQIYPSEEDLVEYGLHLRPKTQFSA
ncbi:hypothetical protein [Acinetobacter haemolyticus]|uniref:MarR family transcriptional regulator n=1 Tax=Acinetobacter haemolyticus TaxID=29430 RepID=A0AAW4J903_ACIHA|nr:hypothetical protein [Acinetobacter haemolyticus]MBO3659327.1 hypothetical protein [Acinetobacter haemolyticus]